MPTNSTYSLEGLTSSENGDFFSIVPEADVAGFGILRPFSRDEVGDFLNGGAERLIRSAVGQVLGTRAAAGQRMGELRWRPEFGSQLYRLRHSNANGILIDIARYYVVEALSRWEPRIKVTGFNITVNNDTTYGTSLVIKMRYSIVAGGRAFALGINPTSGQELEIIEEIR
jgi:phage baseplate assembly protein W